jgi:hypothetical protein
MNAGATNLPARSIPAPALAGPIAAIRPFLIVRSAETARVLPRIRVACLSTRSPGSATSGLVGPGAAEPGESSTGGVDGAEQHESANAHTAARRLIDQDTRAGAERIVPC